MTVNDLLGKISDDIEALGDCDKPALKANLLNNLSGNFYTAKELQTWTRGQLIAAYINHKYTSDMTCEIDDRYNTLTYGAMT